MNCPIIQKIKDFYKWFKGLDCFWRLVWLGVFVIGFFLLRYIVLFFISSDKSITAKDYAEVGVNILGALAIPIVIYWLSSYRAEKIKEAEMQLETLNLLWADLFNVSKNLLSLFDIMLQKKEAINLVKSKLNNRLEDSSSEEGKIDFSGVILLPFANIKFEMDVNNITFISRKDRELFDLLYRLMAETKTLKKLLKSHRELILLNLENRNKDVLSFKNYESKIKYELRYVETIERETDILKKQSQFVLGQIKKSLEMTLSFCKSNYINNPELYPKEKVEKALNEISKYLQNEKK